MLDLAQMRYLEGNFTDCFHISTQTLKNAKDKNKEKLLELAALSALQLGIPQSLELCAEVCNLQRDSLFWTLCFAKALLGQNKAQAAMQIVTNTLNATANNVSIAGSNGDCVIGNVSLMQHKHLEMQSGDVVSPMPS